MYEFDLFTPLDIFSLDLANLDAKTDNYTIAYYLYYLLNHGDECYKIQSHTKNTNEYFINKDIIYGYLIGKYEYNEEYYYGHVTALSIAPFYRRWGLGSALMGHLEMEDLSAVFIDLYVRVGNYSAIEFYKKRGYVIYRTITGYYTHPPENAYDMRKPLHKDRSCCIAPRKVISVHDL
ncbi:N-terminal acetyltransferase B complex catalytic subunit naa20 [Astathelohania contejeani]|uniref:N-terminal acetyltransferase B complex catalytic subunit naa20 n=1 Tax=Astathelohania contejeani TaxID=164912 RepID=A0ABQ7HWK6_9MICR|nr:N-terminal acetyltransferase B complex catalytic subunit naa20 [Thelohania contejeani]